MNAISNESDDHSLLVHKQVFVAYYGDRPVRERDGEHSRDVASVVRVGNMPP
jgi:hypothetical protein